MIPTNATTTHRAMTPTEKQVLAFAIQCLPYSEWIKAAFLLVPIGCGMAVMLWWDRQPVGLVGLVLGGLVALGIVLRTVGALFGKKKDSPRQTHHTLWMKQLLPLLKNEQRVGQLALTTFSIKRALLITDDDGDVRLTVCQTTDGDTLYMGGNWLKAATWKKQFPAPEVTLTYTPQTGFVVDGLCKGERFTEDATYQWTQSIDQLVSQHLVPTAGPSSPPPPSQIGQLTQSYDQVFATLQQALGKGK
jgi:hypothetical protein